MSHALFESFNARTIDPENVGRSFIYSNALPAIAQSSNSVIMGPRGSGKTTLLKMLTIPALNFWENERKKYIIEKIDYFAIYIPSDFTWNPKFRLPLSGGFDENTSDLFSIALFNSHIRLAICDTLEWISKLSLNYSLPNYSEFCIKTEMIERIALNLSQEWQIVSHFPGVFGLRHGVVKQIKSIQKAISMSAVQNKDASEALDGIPGVGEMFLDDLLSLATLFDGICECKARWAFCVDELEIAPEIIKKTVWQSARSFDQRFLIKVSASPFDKSLVSLFGAKMPMRGHDFHFENLSERNSHEVQEFTNELVKQLISTRLGLSIEPADLFGDSIFFSGDDEIPRLAKGGPYQRYFKQLALKDKSFAEFLGNKNVDLNKLDAGTENQKAQIRKHISLVVLRNHFLFQQESKSHYDTRSKRLKGVRGVPEIYTGKKNLFAICEGNPRWIIGLIGSLLDPALLAKQKKISRSQQATNIGQSITSMLMLLSAIGDNERSPHGITLVNLVDLIGNAFNEEVLGEEFNQDPVLSIKIDDKVNERIVDLIGAAINQGALIVIPEKEPVKPGSIRGRRVRLSFLLAPHFRIPLMRGRAIQLSTIIRRADRYSAENDHPLLNELFGGNYD
ncbi:MAG: hypothetical protein GVY13_00090 [Alphaproteobacteria bacterium]|jgi:energy-coupling factor transporter ATP-binding protein EcfA2|nr:hypothetical protein [Alphaproteobacteria bacterium]